MRTLKALGSAFMAVVFFVVLGCTQGGSPVDPEVRNDVSGSADPVVSVVHNLWGLYTFVCNPNEEVIDVITLHDADLHLNALKFLEPPANDFLRIVGQPEFNGNIVDVNIGLGNPYLGLNQFSGFDVCGIVFTQGSMSDFNDSELVMAGDGDTRLLNADGYTRWWNPVEFPLGDTVFNYIDGLLGTPNNIAGFNSTVNGYKYFADGLGIDDPVTGLDLDNRGLFGAGLFNIRHYTIDFSGGLIFNYAVDACWKKLVGEPPYTIPDDFPPDANRPEAYFAETFEIENTLYYEEPSGDAGGHMMLQIHVWDRYDAELNKVYGESPSGIPPMVTLAPINGAAGYKTYELVLPGTGLTHNGDAKVLITIESEVSGYGGLLPGKPVCTYFKHDYTIATENPVDPCDPDLDPPDTFIDTGCEDQPEGTTEITLTVSAKDPNDCTPPLEISFEWRKKVDDNEFGEWVFSFGPEILIPGLFEGQWVVEIRGVDLAVNKDPSPDECSFYIPSPSGLGGWAVNWGGIDGVLPMDIATDSTGNIYISGIFQKTIDFDPGPGVAERTAEDYGYDSFLSKFDTSGNFQWVYTWHNGHNDDLSVIYVCVAEWDSVYVTSEFIGIIDLDPTDGVDEHSADPGKASTFLAKFDAAGNYLWAVNWVGVWITETNVGHCWARGITVDDWGNVFVLGAFQKRVDFDPGPEVVICISPGDDQKNVYLSKFDSNGVFQWVRSWGSAYFDWGNDLATCSNGDVCVIGTFRDTVDFDPGPGTDWRAVHGDDDDSDVYLTKFTANGDFLWVRTWGRDLYDHVCSIAIDSSDNIIVGGYFDDTVDFDPGPGIDEHTAIIDDFYLAMYGPGGTYMGVLTWGGNGRDKILDVTLDGEENLYITGYHGKLTDFDPGPGVYELQGGSSAIFLCKLNSNAQFQWARSWGGEGGDSGKCVTTDTLGNPYVSGLFLETIDFDPGPGGDEHTVHDYMDAFLMKLMPNGYWD